MPGYAADCRYLRRTIESGRLDGPVVTLCTHPIRDGFDCVGPFLDETSTECQLWEEHPTLRKSSVVSRESGSRHQ